MKDKKEYVMSDEAMGQISGGVMEPEDYRCIHCGEFFMKNELEQAKKERCYARSQGCHEFE